MELLRRKPKSFELNPSSVRQITTDEFIQLAQGEVVLVRSSNVSTLGDHFVIIAGPVVQKEHGLRPQVMVISALDPHLLDFFKPVNGVIALLLDQEAKEFFHWWFNIRMKGTRVIHQGYKLQ